MTTVAGLFIVAAFSRWFAFRRLGRGEVVPHEKTYKGPIEDRLKLMEHTSVQLSPVFGLFSDPA